LKGILLHICCAPCATAVLEELRRTGLEAMGYFYNPSIHPWKEFQRRVDTLKEWAPKAGIPIEIDGEYPLEQNVGMLLSADNRCLACFTDRLTRAAIRAGEAGFESFTTTLLVSPYQNRELLEQAGGIAEKRTGVSYSHFDFRHLYSRSAELSKSLGMYRQPYCGCVFSERDRYLKVKSPGSI
jgi:epoxyqueuosine reductase